MVVFVFFFSFLMIPCPYMKNIRVHSYLILYIVASFFQLNRRYYDTVCPLLIHIMNQATDKDQRMLRAKAVECVSLVGFAVGKERFLNDSKTVMEILVDMGRGQQPTDDQTVSYTTQVIV